MHETGPFTLRDLHSRDLLGEIAFTVGRPWGKTSLITSYTTRDILFRPLIREYYQTTTAIGLQRKFTQKFTAGILGEYLRAWRVQDAQFAIAQSMRPAGQFDYRPTNRWAVQGRLAYSRGQGSHFYDNVTSEFLLTYIRPMRHIMNAGDGDVAISYPFRVSVGFQQQTFYNFPGQHGSDFLPVIGLSVF
jgi:hypothetical protein